MQLLSLNGVWTKCTWLFYRQGVEEGTVQTESTPNRIIDRLSAGQYFIA
jgi:hypothetical protein